MTSNAFDMTVMLLAVIAVVLAAWKCHAVRDRHLILTAIRSALSSRTSLWIGIMSGMAYLAVFMILGGRGGRIHVLFGRVIWNAPVSEVLTGILIAVLVMLSMSLFILGTVVLRAKQPGRRGGVGIAGSLLAVLAAFCP